MATYIKFKPITKKFLGALSDRVKKVIVLRFGLGDDGARETLESIGKQYGVTRERIRQIEDFGLHAIRKSDVYKEENSVFDDLSGLMREYGGGIVDEKDFYSHLHKDELIHNHINFLLVLGEQFSKHREDDIYTHRWIIDRAVSDIVHKAISELTKTLSEDDLITEEDIVVSFLEHLKDVPKEYHNETHARRWLSLSKKIGVNPLGEWGVSHSPNINARGIRDYAFLIIRRHGSPMHFTEVAREITNVFEKKAHIATCHNELIKDRRFVLVGRGLYALKEWGYARGIVRDVIADILKKHGTLQKEEIVEHVMKERYVKPNTIIVNLQNPTYFKKNSNGTFSLK